MRKTLFLLCLPLALLFLTGCEPEKEAKETAGLPGFSYTHYASGGTEEEYRATILMEEFTSTFTAYQVAFSSCTCRDALSNYLSVAYVEILNTRSSGDEAAIRSISFGDNRGLWGDSDPNYYVPEYTKEYYDQNFVQKLVRLRKADFDSFQGYGTTPAGVDAISGATVSVSNISSMLKGLLAYHALHYYEN